MGFAPEIIEGGASAPPTMAAQAEVSAFGAAAPRLSEAGFHCIPILPKEKIPGQLSNGQWDLLHAWTQFRDTKPSDFTLAMWSRWPGANIGVVLGVRVGQWQLIAIDYDTDDAMQLDILSSILPISPMQKRGRRGFTSFYLADPEVKTRKYVIKGETILEILTGNATRQTVCPPSIHPNGNPYVWMTGQEIVPIGSLPVLQEDHLEKLEDALSHLGWGGDEAVEHGGRVRSEPDDDVSIWSELNTAALANLDAWVPRLPLHDLRKTGKRYAAVADWRPSSTGRPLSERARNLSIHPKGVKDMGTEERYSPLDLVKEVKRVSLDVAFTWLREQLGIVEPDFDNIVARPLAEMEDGSLVDTATGEIVEDRAQQKPPQPVKGASPLIVASPYVRRDPKTIPKRDWQYGTHLIRKEISATIAPGGVGKTSLAIAETLAMVSGKPLLGIQPPSRLRVWLFNAEEPADELQRRIEAACLKFQLSEDDTGDRLFVDTGHDMSLVLAETIRGGTVVQQPVIDALISEIRRREIDVLLVDPFVSTHRVPENDNGAIQQAATAWKAVAYGANCAIGLAHHSRKLSGREATSDDARGGAALVDKARAVRALNPMSDAEADEFGIPRVMRRSYFSIDASGAKANMSATTGGKVWFETVSQHLDNGTSGGNLDFGDSVAVVRRWTPPEAASPDIPAHLLSELKVKLRAGPRWKAAPQASRSPHWIGRAIADVWSLDMSDTAAWKRAAKSIFKQLLDAGDVVVVSEMDPETRQPRQIVLSSDDPSAVDHEDYIPPDDPDEAC